MAKYLRSSYPERRYFERGANILKESIIGRRISFSAGAPYLSESLMKVRMLPNGRLDLFTVNEMVRSNFHILASNVFKDYYEKEK